MYFDSFNWVELSESVLDHIWIGDALVSGRGGHRFGAGRPNKTEFPAHWTREMVSDAVRLTLVLPQSILQRPPRLACLRHVGGVIVQVNLLSTSDGLVVRTAFPRCGDGVVQNIAGTQVQVPLDFTILEA